MGTSQIQLDRVRNMETPDNIARLFKDLGYNVEGTAQPLDIDALELPARSQEALLDAYLIANHRQGNEWLQVLLLELQDDEWASPGIASGRLKAMAKSLCSRASDFLLLGVSSNYQWIMLVNPRKESSDGVNFKVGIRKLLIDRTNPTAYDRDRLEAIAAHNLSPRQIYQKQCEAFDVEKLTKKFYAEYRSLFEQVQQVVLAHNPCSYFADSDRLHQFSQRLLGRIMFLYFLQKKEFLAGDRKFLTKAYKRMRPDHEDCDYYAHVLEPLFFETLNQQRPNCESRWGKIPYLNGGLFDRDYGPGIKDAAGRQTPETIALPNSLFDPGDSQSILGFFNGYNFTISENVVGDEDVAVDPEMLGKVFENMLAAEERGKSGTFYTPRGIVQFMCAEVLSRYVADASGMTPDAIRELMELDPDTPDADFNQRLTRDQARSIKTALNTVKILDPAVGSGAFPLGMMQTILAVRQAVARREGMTVQRGSLALSQWKRDIIANNLYGVDIKPGAIEIAKLRMWLSLVVDIPEIDDVEPLPNLDYKLMCGDSLISTIHGETIIPDPTKNQQGILAVTPIQQAIQPLLDLQHQYFSAQSQERHALRQQILEAEANIFRVAVADRVQYLKGQQREIERKLRIKPSKPLEKQKAELAAKQADLEKFAAEVERGDRSLSFFNYHLHFRDVFDEKGGFDCVIGNPPYVRMEAIQKESKANLEAEFECHNGRADLLVYFYERGLRLLRSSAYLTYITSNKYMRSGYGKKLRSYLTQHTIEHIIDFGDADVFEAIAYPSIILMKRAVSPNHQITALNWEKGGSLEEFDKTFRTQSFLIQQKELTADGWQLVSPSVFRLMDKLQAAGTPLGEYVKERFYRGIVTGLNEAFVVDRETRDRLIAEHPSSEEILKPFIRGRDVKRWCVDYQDLWLIFTRRGIEIENFPSILNYLKPFKANLLKRATANLHPWYELQQPQEGCWQEFEKPKIVYQEIATYQAFAWDEDKLFSNNKTYLIPNSTYYLLALLNSKSVWYFLKQTVVKMAGGAFAMQSIYLQQVPIPNASEPDRLAIEALVQKCLDSKGKNCKQWEAEIDDRVAHLYGLTAEDMKIIRGE